MFPTDFHTQRLQPQTSSLRILRLAYPDATDRKDDVAARGRIRGHRLTLQLDNDSFSAVMFALGALATGFGFQPEV